MMEEKTNCMIYAWYKLMISRLDFGIKWTLIYLALEVYKSNLEIKNL